MSNEKLSRIDSIDDSDKVRQTIHDTVQSESRRTSFAATATNTHSRRQSRYSFASRKSIFGGHGSLSGMLRGAGGNKAIKYENTYHLKPKPSEKVKQKPVGDLLSSRYF
ncbi:unnamed protein product [Trichobilharzia regenti]|nr:unnamed protein product [Trichobilharzia regenti]